MFSTMDNTKVYDKQDIDNTLGTPTPGVSGTAFERITSAEDRILQNEHAISTLNRDKATTARVQAIEAALSNKANAADITPLVQAAVTDTIEAKVNEIAGTFETTIDTKVSSAVATAVDNNSMTTAEATAIVNNYF